MGEGAGAFRLEEESHAKQRGATVYTELAGFGASSDASQITRPQAQGQHRAMVMALEDAGLSPTDIGYINAHGSATRVGDVVGTNAIKAAFRESATRVPVSSAKALHGHLMGPTGLVEILAALISMREQTFP